MTLYLWYNCRDRLDDLMLETNYEFKERFDTGN